MEKNEVKKFLYKAQPQAHLEYIRKGVAHYYVAKGQEYSNWIRFEVPVSDMGDADFYPIMEAKLLIRYLS